MRVDESYKAPTNGGKQIMVYAQIFATKKTAPHGRRFLINLAPLKQRFAAYA
jgi:hypothetical protein